MKTAATLLLVATASATDPAWHKTGQTHSVMLGVAAPHGHTNECFFAGADSGKGALAFVTNDGCQTFTTSQPTGLSFFDAGAMPDGQTAVLSQLLGGHRTTDQGKTWQQIIGGIGGSQSVEAFGSSSFGMAGKAGGKNGVAVSTDAGQAWTMHDASPGLNDTNHEHARYAAYPSASTWYISGGAWDTKANRLVGARRCSPNMDGTSRGVVSKLLTDRLAVCSEGGVQVLDPLETTNGDSSGNGYVAAIAKTTDGGKTFTNVFRDAGRMYMNGIHCATEMHCIGVAEGHNVPQPGTYTVVTKDGGRTWNVTQVGQGADTLMAARDLEDQGEGWALGGQLSASMVLGAFHTRDGGETFENDGADVKGVTILAADFSSKERGYAAVVTNLQQSSMIYYE